MIETLLNFKCFSYQFNALSFQNKKVQVEVVLRHWKEFIISDKLLRGTDNLRRLEGQRFTITST